jgi:acyl-CoA dehydrogenase
LSEQGIMLERVARSRIEIDSARLAVLNAAIKIDESNSKEARKEIAKVKVQVPSVLLDVIDRAMQAYGAAGVSQDTPLARMWASGRTMRIVDGPDEVHMVQLGRNETKKGTAFRRRIKSQDAKSALLFAKYGMVYMDDLQLNRVTTKASL